MKNLRIISIMLAIMFVCSSLTPVLAKNQWDGFVSNTESLTSEETLVNMNSLSVVIATGAEPSTKHLHNSIYTAHWYNHPSKKLLSLPCTTLDWSRYENISIPVYSVKNTGANLRVVAYLSTDSATSYKCSFPINWEGLKTLEVDIVNDLGIGTAYLDKIGRFELWTGGWGDVPDSESDLYIGTITASIKQISADTVTEEEMKHFSNLLGDGFAVHNYSRNLFTKGKTFAIDSSNHNAVIKTRNNESVCPVGLLKTISGATIKTEENKATITLGEKTIIVTADSPEYTTGGEAKTFNAEPFITEGVLYVPLVTCAGELGLNAKNFDNLTVIADKKVLSALDENSKLVKAGAKILSQQVFSANDITAEDFAAVKKNWRESLVGSEELNNLNDADIKYYVDKVELAAKTAYKNMNIGEDILILFGDKFPEVSNDMTKQYEKLLAVTLGYGTYGTSMYMDPKVKKDIIFGLEWLYENLYGQDEIKNEGWRDIEAYNWHDWFVGTPQALEKILFIMEPGLRQADIDKYMSFFNWRKTVVYTGSVAEGGDLSEAMTRLYVCTGSAILAEDAEYLFKLYSDFDFALRVNETSMVEKGEKDGVHTDGMWVHHNKHPYQAMYGKEIVYDRAQIVLDVLGGTKLDPTLQNKHNLVEFLFDTFDPVTFHGVFMPGVKGRSPGEDYNDVATLIRAAIELIGDFGPEDDERLKSFVKRHVRFDTENYDEVLAKLPISDITLFKEILSDETIKTYNPPSKMYYSGDVAVQHRSDYSVGLRMSSERIANYESLNDANKNGWYTGDGMLFIYPYYDSYPFQYSAVNFYGNYNAYHVPGTTEDSQERQRLSINAANEYLPKQDFVGGVEVDNEYILAAMDFKAFNNDVPPTGDYSGYGGMQPLHDNDLVAKKSWFMFDNEVLALGSGINSTKNSKVVTTVENQILKENIVPEDTTVKEKYMIYSATATGDDGNIPENVIDGDLSTRWSCEGATNSILTLDLREAKRIGYVGIAQYQGGARKAIFDLEVSNDGVNWKTLFEGTSSGTTEQLEYYLLDGGEYRYIRYDGHAREGSVWNSVTEFEVYAPLPGGGLPKDVSSQTIYGSDDIIVDGSMMEKENVVNRTFSNPGWMHIENRAGYIFPNGGNLILDKNNTVNNTVPFIELLLDHGENPVNATYAYVILPTATSEQTSAYAKAPDIEILSNTPEIHAAKDKSTKLTGIVFWKDGSFENITVSSPCTMMIRDTDEYYEMYISDPTQKLESVNIKIDADLELSDADKSITATENGKITELKVDFSEIPGKTHSIKFKKTLTK